MKGRQPILCIKYSKNEVDMKKQYSQQFKLNFSYKFKKLYQLTISVSNNQQQSYFKSILLIRRIGGIYLKKFVWGFMNTHVVVNVDRFCFP